MKLGIAIKHFQAACERNGIPGDTREGKGRYYFRLKGKRVITFEFRPYRWVFFRFEREPFVATVDAENITKAPAPHEPGPNPVAVFSGTLPADDEAMLRLLDRFVAAVASGDLPMAAKAVEPEGEAAEPGETA